MEWPLQCTKEALVRIGEDEPVRAYAVACHHGLEDEARQCAKFALRIPIETIISTNIEELRIMDGSQFQRLLHYRNRCKKVAVSVARRWSWTRTNPLPFWVTETCCPRESRPDAAGTLIYAQGWWFKMMGDMAIELEECSWADVIQPALLLNRFITHHNSLLCGNCRPRAAIEIVAFTTCFSERVREEIDQVSRSSACCSVSLLRRCRVLQVTLTLGD